LEKPARLLDFTDQSRVLRRWILAAVFSYGLIFSIWQIAEEEE
jgi:hypothetical protein